MSLKSQVPRAALVTTVLVGATFLVSLDLFIVNVAFDEIGRDLAAGGASLADLSWVLTAYAVVFAALLVPMGRLTDRYGRKSGFVAGLAVFTVASVACGFSGSVWQLVGFRALQAVGAAALTPASLGLLLAALPEARRAPAARLWALSGAVAAALGPAAGGALVQASWQWAFWINVPVGLVLAAGAALLVPDVRHNAGAPRPDLREQHWSRSASARSCWPSSRATAGGGPAPGCSRPSPSPRSPWSRSPGGRRTTRRR